ncbi:hypothetical protein TorRG33x02_142470 [Trema orientale]|uniref:Uncharacterized protein n=1 Tax=Trema orientale TaxID=63057 RepID=A0A2P5EWP7_TREOI|nr:hypothetical protein TorRG33x02_142470 [Trema orientale]
MQLQWVGERAFNCSIWSYALRGVLILYYYRLEKAKTGLFGEERPVKLMKLFNDNVSCSDIIGLRKKRELTMSQPMATTKWRRKQRRRGAGCL